MAKFEIQKDKKTDAKFELAKEEQVVVVSDETVATVNLTHTAVGQFLDPETQRYNLVKIQYDPLSKTVGLPTFVDTGGKDATVMAFKILAVDLKFV